MSRFLPDATGCTVSLATEKTRIHIFGSYMWPANTNVTVNGLSEGQAESLVRHVANSLAISPQAEPKQRPSLAASIFVGYSFDGAGKEVADFVITFLRTLDFDVVSGEPFEVGRVSDKVKALIRQASVVLCIFTRPVDGGKPFSQWVRDEATFAAALDRPLFVLLERGIDGIPGIHGDLEQIRFDHNNLAPVLLKLLQGLNALGLRVGVAKKEPRRGLLQRLLGLRAE